MSILISFLIGLFLGLIVMGLAAAVSREEQLDGKEDDDEIRLIKAENAALTDIINALLEKNEDLEKELNKQTL
jgi:hypothetical protein